MTDPDIVAELDAWLADTPRIGQAAIERSRMIQRARDEIVALRAETDREGSLLERQSKTLTAVRAEALEEAAQACQALPAEYPLPLFDGDLWAGCRRRFSAAIRALKDKP